MGVFSLELTPIEVFPTISNTINKEERRQPVGQTDRRAESLNDGRTKTKKVKGQKVRKRGRQEDEVQRT